MLNARECLWSDSYGLRLHPWTILQLSISHERNVSILILFILNIPYYSSIYFFLIGEDTKDCTFNMTEWSSDPSIERCPEEDWTVLAVSAFYMLFSNLLLVNLVIAMFRLVNSSQIASCKTFWGFLNLSQRTL